MKAVVAAFNQEKALVGAFSVITNLRMELFQALFSAVAMPGIRSAVPGYLPLPALHATEEELSWFGKLKYCTLHLKQQLPFVTYLYNIISGQQGYKHKTPLHWW